MSEGSILLVLAHGARFEEMEMNKQNTQLLNLFTAPRSTEIIDSHGHSTTPEGKEIKGIVVPNDEVCLA